MSSKNWDILENIHRGQACDACGADWKPVEGHSYRELIHKPRCSFWAWMKKERTQ